MARNIIIIALAMITVNPGSLIFINTLHNSNNYSIFETQKPHFIQSNNQGTVISLQNIFWKFFQSEDNGNNCSEDQHSCVIKLSKQARVVKSS